MLLLLVLSLQSLQKHADRRSRRRCYSSLLTLNSTTLINLHGLPLNEQ